MKIRNYFPGQIVLVLTICMTCFATINTPAAENRTPITDIRLDISSDIEAGSDNGEIYVTAKSSHYTVRSVEIQNDTDYKWMVGVRPKATVWLNADSNCYFYSSSSDVFTFTGLNTDFVSARTKDYSTTMILTFRLDELDGDLEIDKAEWEDNTGTGYWSDSDDASSYQVRLYRNGSWPANTWKYINNHWYYFKPDGYMGTGWILWNNIWYYCDLTTGVMCESTRTPDGYTVGHNGEWLAY